MAPIYGKKTNYAFGQLMLAVFLVVGAIIFLSFKIYNEADLYLGVLYHHLRTACQCTDVVQFLNMHPVIFAEVGIFAFTIFSFMLFSVHRFLKLYFATKKYAGYYSSFRAAKKHSWKLGCAVRESGIAKEKVIECRSEDVVVFCYGFLSPKICISNSLVKLLDRSELKAVLLHEKQHMESHEPLKLFIAIYFQNILFILPGIGKLVRKYLTFSELSADEQACVKSYGKPKLASAMYKIAEQEEGRLAADISSSAIIERINRLFDNAYVPNFKHLGRSLIACSIVFAFVSMAVLSALANSTKAYDMHSEGLCTLENNKKIDFFDALTSEQESCDMQHVVSHEANETCEAK